MTTSTVSTDYSSLVATLNAATSSSGTSGSTTSDATAALSDRFLTLLVAQLQNQDPLNPTDNAELTSQLAQLSTVEGISKLNDTVSALSSSLLSTQVLQGASLVGHQVLAEGNALELTDSGALGAVDLSSSVDTMKINIYDSAGTLVRSLSVGAQDAGLVYFTWDGQATDGTQLGTGSYSYKVEATANGTAVDNTAYALGSVLSVSLQDSSLVADVSGLGSRSIDQIKQYF
ncbi:MAG TPA: flagellar hook capping FlgD N-terminal domain-containing protein [Thiobacillaceae bacterium]|nr:flagellar hook capping FlgD N-terminal domain-containing protein [Thiobacillaceae bacterium]